MKTLLIIFRTSLLMTGTQIKPASFSVGLNIKLKMVKWHKQHRHHPAEIPQLNKLECPTFISDTSTLKRCDEYRKKSAKNTTLFHPDFFNYIPTHIVNKMQVTVGRIVVVQQRASIISVLTWTLPSLVISSKWNYFFLHVNIFVRLPNFYRRMAK